MKLLSTMKIHHQNKTYDTVYSPFCRVSKCKDFAIFSLRYPSGKIEDMVVFNQEDFIPELKAHLLFLLKEYALEKDEMLTEKAKELKEDVKALFGIDS